MTVFLQSLGGHFEVFKWFIFLAQLLTTQKKERKKERRKERKKERGTDYRCFTHPSMTTTFNTK